MPMGRIYSAQVSAVAVTAAQDIFEITPAAGKAVVIHGWSLLQTTDVGDAAEEVLRIETVRGVGATSGSGGSVPTSQPLVDTDTAAGVTVEANNTTRMTVGLEVLEQYGWNVRIPWVHWYTPELRPAVRAAATPDRWTLSLPAAPVDSITVSATVWYEELG